MLPPRHLTHAPRPPPPFPASPFPPLTPITAGGLFGTYLSKETLAHARLLSGLTELLGPDIDAWQVATVVKSPELRWCGGGYSWHQDVAD